MGEQTTNLCVNTNVSNSQLIAKPITSCEITAGSFEVILGLLNLICNDHLGGSATKWLLSLLNGIINS